jgi:hypothetical protein
MKSGVLSVVLQVCKSDNKEFWVIRLSSRSELMLGDGVGDAIGGITEVGDGEGFIVGLTTGTPLFHTSFLPDLMQVYFFPFDVEVVPTFLQVSPALIAADDI